MYFGKQFKLNISLTVYFLASTTYNNKYLKMASMKFLVGAALLVVCLALCTEQALGGRILRDVAATEENKNAFEDIIRQSVTALNDTYQNLIAKAPGAKADLEAMFAKVSEAVKSVGTSS